MHLQRWSRAGALLALVAAAGWSRAVNRLPDFVSGPIRSTHHDGVSDDLLTGGLGASGLAAAVPPAFANPVAPTAAELRTRAIYNNYRALVDTTTGGGYGVLYGPSIDVTGAPTLGQGKVAGTEYLAYADDGTGRENVTMMVQVPDSFDPAHPCIVTATSSGSRGVYGAIATAGEWGLKHGCAVAYTDKGTGNGAHDLTNDRVSIITGERESAAVAGLGSNFTAPLSSADLAAFVAGAPNRYAYKHAHSRQNPERSWGRDTLRAIRFAFFVLNQQFAPGASSDRGKAAPPRINPGNTITIASSVSNGGGAALAAAEEDEDGLVTGVVAGEPQIQVRPDENRVILRGGVPVASHGRPLLDYGTVANLFQPCAALSAQLAASPGLAFVPAALAANRCATLHQAGLLAATTLSAQADESLAALRATGWEAESDLLHASHYAFATVAIAVTYGNAYGRFGVEEGLCGLSFAGTSATGAPAPLAAAADAQLFASGNGIPPSGGVNVVADRAKNGPILDALAVSASSGLADLDADAALCLRALVSGNDAAAQRAQEGVAEVLHDADLHGKPALLVQGRSDALVPVNNASRAYVAQNKLAEGKKSRVHYLEITNAQHFDAFIGSPLLPGYAARFVPLHRYFVQAMDLMYRHLRFGEALPESQVVRTTPRGGTPPAVPNITPANVPPAPITPAAADRITFVGEALSIPD
jgi:hydroxybutyrate-dimer hydrolase